jgi:hypothetical protein
MAWVALMFGWFNPHSFNSVIRLWNFWRRSKSLAVINLYHSSHHHSPQRAHVSHLRREYPNPFSYEPQVSTMLYREVNTCWIQYSFTTELSDPTNRHEREPSWAIWLTNSTRCSSLSVGAVGNYEMKKFGDVVRHIYATSGIWGFYVGLSIGYIKV